MKSLEFSPAEKKLANFNFDQLQSQAASAKANIAGAASVDDIKTEICRVWTQVRPYVIWAENVPVVGKFITILADVLDSICGTVGGN